MVPAKIDPRVMTYEDSKFTPKTGTEEVDEVEQFLKLAVSGEALYPWLLWVMKHQQPYFLILGRCVICCGVQQQNVSLALHPKPEFST